MNDCALNVLQSLKMILNVSKYKFGSLKMILSWSTHVLIGLLNSKRKAWPCKDKVLQSFNKAPIRLGIR